MNRWHHPCPARACLFERIDRIRLKPQRLAELIVQFAIRASRPRQRAAGRAAPASLRAHQRAELVRRPRCRVDVPNAQVRRTAA